MHNLAELSKEDKDKVNVDFRRGMSTIERVKYRFPIQPPLPHV